MLRHGYDKRLAAGTVAATATLAQILPPATVLVLLGDQLNNSLSGRAARQGQLRAGLGVGRPICSPARSCRDLTLVALYLVFIVAVAVVRPAAVPPIRDSAPRGMVLLFAWSKALVAPVLLIIVVLGSILIGLATPTEAAAVGAVGAVLLAALRSERAQAAVAVCLGAFAVLMVSARRARSARRHWLRARPDRDGGARARSSRCAADVHRAGYLVPTITKTAQITSMIFTILIGATLFSLVFRGLGGDDMVHRALANLPGGAAGAILIVMVAMFLLGFVMDAFEIIFVVVPIVAPPLLQMPGVDPVWLGIMMAVNLQTSYMHPPLGPTLFFLRGVAPPEITTRHIYVGIIPFVLIQLVMLVVLWFAPGLATALPRMLYGG